MKKVKKDAIEITKASIVMGVGGTAISRVPGASGAGIGALSRFVPTMGAVTGAKHTIKMTEELSPKRKKGKRR